MAVVLRPVMDRLRRLPWARFTAGAAAGAAALVLTFILRLLGLGLFLPEVAVDFVVGRIPGSLESFFIQTMGEGAKLLGLAAAVAAGLVVPGVYATLYRRLQAKLKSRWVLLGVNTFAYAGAILLLALPLLDGGLGGSQTSVGPWGSLLSQAMAGWLYAGVLDYLLVDVPARHPQGFRLSRRQFIVASALAVAGTAAALYGLANLLPKTGRLRFDSADALLAREVTPSEEFYVVTKNVIDPEVDATGWSLTIDGFVDRPSTYVYSDLQAMANVEEYVTLECVSNQVGGDLISNALWSGLRLADLLGLAGVQTGAAWVAFTCVDGYTVGIPLAKALDPNTLLALRMGAGPDQLLPLASKHGFPARIVVPGLYGMFHAKWVNRITLLKDEFLGFWQQKGWTNRGAIRTTAIIATPAPDAVVRPPVTIAGVAFSGDQGISRVEVSTDGGATWAEANLRVPPKSSLTWVLWTFPWAPSSGGAFKIIARAVDGRGTPQETSPSPPFPDGASGYDSVTLLVSQ